MQIRRSILILVVMAACLGSYFNSLFGDFVWDDKTFFTTKQYNRSFEFLPQFFVKEFWNVYDPHMSAGYYRPLLALAFMINYSLWGEGPFGYHLVNLILHTLVCLMIFVFLDKLIRNRIIAFTSALLFAVHPIHTEAVSFISNISYVLATFFFMSSLILFLKYAQDNKRINYLFSLVCFFASLLIIEVSITLPLIILCIGYLFISKYSLKKTLKESFEKYLGFFIVLGIYLLMRSYAVGWAFLERRVFVETNFLNGTNIFWRLFTSIKILLYYIRTLFLPYDLKVEYFFRPANSLFEPIVALGLIGLSLLIYLCKKNIKSHPILSFSILWFFITTLPVSNIIPQGNIFAERYMYIPSIGFCMGIGFLFSWLLKKDIKTKLFNYKKSIVFIFILLVLALGRVTYERNKVWENDFTLWYDAVKASPASSRAHLNLATTYHNLGFFDLAENELKFSLKLHPFNFEALFTLGNNYIKKGLIDQAIAEFNSTINLSPKHSRAYTDLSAAYILKQQYPEAIRLALLALDINPYLDSARYNLALSYLKSGLIDEAVKEFKEYLKNNNDDGIVYSNLAIAYGMKGQYKEAIGADLKALEKDPFLTQASYNLALNYLKIGLIDKAIESYERHLRVSPDNPDVHLEVGHLYYRQGNYQKAREHWLKCLDIFKGYQPALESLRLLEE